jgi:hypothetical protein
MGKGGLYKLLYIFLIEVLGFLPLIYIKIVNNLTLVLLLLDWMSGSVDSFEIHIFFNRI